MGELSSTLLSVTEAAQQLGLSRAEVKTTRLGTLPGIKVGSVWVIPAAAVAKEG